MTITREFFLAFGKTGSARVSIAGRGKTEPMLNRGERLARIKLELPDNFFDIPSLKATVKVDPGAVAGIPEIDVQTAGDALSAAIGCDVDLQIIPPDRPAGAEEEE